MKVDLMKTVNTDFLNWNGQKLSSPLYTYGIVGVIKCPKSYIKNAVGPDDWIMCSIFGHFQQ